MSFLIRGMNLSTSIMNLEAFTDNELNALMLEIRHEWQRRKEIIESKIILANELNQSKFSFNAWGKNGKAPYIAILYLSGKHIKRRFVDLFRVDKGKQVLIHGEYSLPNYALVDIRSTGERYYALNDNGELKKLGSYGDAQTLKQIQNYLFGSISLDILLELLDLKDYDNTVPDDIKD